MGIFSKEAEKSYMESGLLLSKAPEDYYKSKMFYGNVQVYVDAQGESEAKYFAARAINDFDTFCKCYTPDKSEKLNGIVVKPVGESNVFSACLTDITTGDKVIEHVTIREGKVIDVSKRIITKEAALDPKDAEEAEKEPVDTVEDDIGGVEANNKEAAKPAPEVKEEPKIEAARDF